MRRNEPITHVMTKNPATAHKGQKLSDVRQKMAELQCHHMPVVSGSKLIGMISSTDLLRVTYDYGQNVSAVNAELDHTRSIEDVMQPGVMTISTTGTVREAAEVFAKNWFHALPVVDDGELVGIVTTTDIMKYLLEQY